MTIEVSSTDPRNGKALALFARCEDWQTGHLKDGRSFFAIPGSEPGLFHMADARECTCPDFRHRGERCKHIRAVRLWLAAFKAGTVRPRGRTDSLAEQTIALTPAGAAAIIDADDLGLASEDDPGLMVMLADIAAKSQQPRRRYEDLFPDDGSDFDPIGAVRRRAAVH